MEKAVNRDVAQLAAKKCRDFGPADAEKFGSSCRREPAPLNERDDLCGEISPRQLTVCVLKAKIDKDISTAAFSPNAGTWTRHRLTI